ncbi:hypothetical protein GJ744_010384 [Endocarpon pusillum]|uniref:Uncharacterized protein n=1 Tax=Endocarpon pusillum TaxID=364733 RepID=A0A8H7AE60_9EURO|nr:hypothetical protein GJ744_010384 [Endocarpon pusillum]
MDSADDALASASTHLDRAPLDTYSTTELHHQDGHLSQNLIDADNESTSSPIDADSKVLAKVRTITTKVKAKLHPRKHDETFIHDDQRVIEGAKIAPTLAPPAPTGRDDDRLFNALPEKPSGPSLKQVVAYPVNTVKSAAGRQGGDAYAENLAKTDITHGANVNIVRAYDIIANTTTDADRVQAMQDLERLEKSRQDSFVRWTMDRHVQKVRRVETVKLPRRPRTEFVEKIEHGRYRTQWKEYGDYLLHFYIERYGAQYIGTSDELPKATQSAIISVFERLILTSAPYQKLLMKSSEVALWKQPKRSACYMAVYFILWWYDCLAGSALLALLGLVIKRRSCHPTIEELRQELERSENADLTALSIPQLIEQHGAQGWVNALVEKTGPSVLSQLEDMANFLEVLQNFYEWRDPSHTKASLGKLAILSLVVIFTPLRLLVKSFLFVIGLIFFVLVPLWHRYPQYRLLTSPMKLIFWKVPTHAEWAVARLQAEAAFQLEAMQSAASEANDHGSTAMDDASTTNIADTPVHDREHPGTLIGRYHCTSRNRHGNLTVTTQDVSFKQHLSKDRSWRLRYDQLKTIDKIVGSSTISPGDGLLFTDTENNEFRIAGLSNRDQVFTQIVGYSSSGGGVGWQVNT